MPKWETLEEIVHPTSEMTKDAAGGKAGYVISILNNPNRNAAGYILLSCSMGLLCLNKVEWEANPDQVDESV